MSAGSARRATFDSLAAFATCIGRARSPHEAIALGALRDDLPDQVQITTKARLEWNGSAAHLIARTGDHSSTGPLSLRSRYSTSTRRACRQRSSRDRRARRLLAGARLSAARASDGRPRGTRIDQRRNIPHRYRRAIAGIRRPPAFILVTDGADIERSCAYCMMRCWLHGLGWLMVGAGGQLLDRSLVDRMVYAPERLVFEGAPVLDPPLAQDQASRRALTYDGTPLDALGACAVTIWAGEAA